jgi:hypothetical protein
MLTPATVAIDTVAIVVSRATRLHADGDSREASMPRSIV